MKKKRINLLSIISKMKILFNSWNVIQFTEFQIIIRRLYWYWIDWKVRLNYCNWFKPIESEDINLTVNTTEMLEYTMPFFDTQQHPLSFKKSKNAVSPAFFYLLYLNTLSISLVNTKREKWNLLPDKQNSTQISLFKSTNSAKIKNWNFLFVFIKC